MLKSDQSVLDGSELPDVVTTVKEWLTKGSDIDPYRDLILRKH